VSGSYNAEFTILVLTHSHGGWSTSEFKSTTAGKTPIGVPDLTPSVTFFILVEVAVSNTPDLLQG